MSCTSSIASAALALVFLAGLSQAQRTYVVDAAGRAGSHFKTVDAAVAVAKHGDTVRIRAGSYVIPVYGMRIDQGITIRGDGPVILRCGLLGFDVTGLPVGRNFVLTNVAVTWFQGAALRFDRNQGSVICSNVRVQPFFKRGLSGRGVSLRACKSVVLHGCIIEGRPSLVCDSSQLLITGSSVVGANAEFNTVQILSSPGLRAVNSDVTIATSVMRGGDESPGWLGTQLASPGIWLERSKLTLAGSSVVHAGVARKPWPGMTAIWIHDSHVRAGRHVQLHASRRALPYWVGGVSTFRTEHVTSVLAWADKKTLGVEIRADRGDIAVTFLGTPTARIQHALGGLWLDPNTLIPVDAAAIGASGVRRIRLQLPRANLLVGVQSAVRHRGVWQLSTPSVAFD